MRILITGINGFIGTHLAKALIQRGHIVSGLGHDEGGVLDHRIVERAIRGAEVVVHLAALTQHKDIEENKFEALETNLQGTKNILDAFSKSKKARKFLYSSTGKVYGKIVHLPISEDHPTNPQNTLGKSKLITEKLIDFYVNDQKEFIIFRIFNVYGPGQRESFLIPTVLKQLEKGKGLVLGDIKTKRDYVYIDDLVDSFVKAIEHTGVKSLSIYNICTGKSFSARQIVKLIEKIKGEKIKVKSMFSKVRHDEEKDEYGSYEKTKKTFGWEPKVYIEQGLRKLIMGNAKALVLAGGEGKRMQKLFPKTPKLMIPIKGKPFLDYLINYLKNNDCSEIILSTGYLGKKVEKYLKKQHYSLPITITQELRPLGTGGAISLAKKMFSDDFFLLFGDVYTEVNLKKVLAFHKKNKAMITAVVHKSAHPLDSNLVEFDKKGRVTKMLIKPHGRDGKNLYSLAALYILNDEIGEYLPRKAYYDFEKDFLFKLVDENAAIYAYNTSEFIMDFGTSERLQKLEKRLRE